MHQVSLHENYEHQSQLHNTPVENLLKNIFRERYSELEWERNTLIFHENKCNISCIIQSYFLQIV